MSLGRMFEESCVRYSKNVATIFEENTLTYEELCKAVNALGNELKRRGITKGHTVAIMFTNCPEFVISYFAIQKIGAVALTLSVFSTPHELRYLLNDSDAKCLITETALVKKFEEIREETPNCCHLITSGELTANSLDFREILDKGSFTLETPDIANDDPAVMIYTAGLTGRPLGAVLTHHNLLTQANLLGDEYGCNERDRGVALIPLFHAFGASVNMLGPIRIGAGIVLMDNFTVKGLFSAIEKEKVTYIAAVPRLFLAMIMHKGSEKYDLGSLEFCITGGSAMPPDFIPLFEEKFQVILREGYGLTEASPVCAVGRKDMVHKPGSIGTVIPGTEAKVVDDKGCDIKTGEIGELVIRGDNVMKGYYKDEEATARVIKNGWLYTSDLARIDDDGYIYLTGRKKRMIITSGYNVYPREVEKVLELHPAVKESMVVGKEDLMRGEVVKALIVRQPGIETTEKEITRHCRIYLSSYKVPRKVEFVDVIEMPKN
jgi:long-chain acyl-CoA synthetase